MLYKDVQDRFEKLNRYFDRKLEYRKLKLKRTSSLPRQGQSIPPVPWDSIPEFIPFTDIQDLAEDLAKGVWDCKDYIKIKAQAQGIEWGSIEAEINKKRELCIIADLANSIKHGGLNRRPRSGIQGIHINGLSCVGHPVMGEEELIPVITPDSLEMTFQLTNFQIAARVNDKNGSDIGELFELSKKAHEQWEEIISDFAISI